MPEVNAQSRNNVVRARETTEVGIARDRRGFMRQLLVCAAAVGMSSCLPYPPIENANSAHTVVTIEPVSSRPEVQDVKGELIRQLRLEEGFENAMETQRVFHLIEDGEQAPNFEQVTEVFTPEMLLAARRFHKPTLILINKEYSFRDLINAMDGHKIMSDQNNAFVRIPFREHQDMKPEEWGAYIVEGAGKVDNNYFDDVDAVLGKRIRGFASYKSKNKLGGMDRWKYTQFMMQAIKDRHPVDVGYWTILDEDPILSESAVPHVGWELPNTDEGELTNPWVVFNLHYDPSHQQFKRGWFRPSVGGDIPGMK